MHRVIQSIFFSVILLLCEATHAEDRLTIAVAANIKFAFDDLAAAFTKETGIEITPVYGSSGKIVSQVSEGAPYDLFLSADMAYPEKLYKDGHAAGPPAIYAYGKLALWTARHDLVLDARLQALAGPGVRKVAVANPRVAPYGAEAIRAIEKLGLRAALEPKLVFSENIAQVIQFVDSGNVDAGLTAKSLVIAPEMKGRGKWIDVPPSAYNPIAQGAVVLQYGLKTHPYAAKRFFEYLYSIKARKILADFDYGLP